MCRSTHNRGSRKKRKTKGNRKCFLGEITSNFPNIPKKETSRKMTSGEIIQRGRWCTCLLLPSRRISTSPPYPRSLCFIPQGFLPSCSILALLCPAGERDRMAGPGFGACWALQLGNVGQMTPDSCCILSPGAIRQVTGLLPHSSHTLKCDRGQHSRSQGDGLVG